MFIPILHRYDAHGSWDGSLSIPNEWNGIAKPIVVMTAVPGPKATGAGRAPTVVLATVHATDPTDPFLLSWTKDAANPIQIRAADPKHAAISYRSTPGQVWKNGDHWNMLILGHRYTTKDPSLHTWEFVETGKFLSAPTRPGPTPWPGGESGGQWFSKLAPR